MSDTLRPSDVGIKNPPPMPKAKKPPRTRPSADPEVLAIYAILRTLAKLEETAGRGASARVLEYVEKRRKLTTG